MADFPMPKNQNLNIKRYDYRLTFAKTGRARYISHLDLMRTMQRAFKRAGIPVWYTQGFNPHAYLNFPLALSLGIDSETEFLDVALTEELEFDDIVSRLNNTMPEGIYVVKADKPVKKHTEIGFAEYELDFCCSGITAQEAELRFKHFVSRDKIEIEKRSKKKGINLVDIKPYINIKSLSSDNMVRLVVALPAGCEFNLNTSAVMDAFCSLDQVEIDRIYTTRTKIMCKNFEDFM